MAAARQDIVCKLSLHAQPHWIWATVALALFASARGISQELPREEGLFITVATPISRESVKRVTAATDRALASIEPVIRKLILDFNPGGRPNTTPDYGDCRDLAEHLARRKQIKTIAFVHGEVSGHAVLPVLACQDIVMTRDGRLGNVLHDRAEPLAEDQLKFYENLVQGRRNWAVVHKMIDPGIELLKAVKLDDKSEKYIDRRRESDERKRGMVAFEPMLAAGVAGYYTPEAAQRFGLCDLIVEDKAGIIETYRLTPGSRRADLLEGRDPVAERYVINERITPALRQTLERRIRQAIGRRQSNVIIIQLECSGGDTTTANDLAEFLRELKDDSGMSIMTIAYIPKEAPGAATIVALGCSEIVMGPHATIGDFKDVVGQQGERQPLLEEMLTTLAQRQSYPKVLIQGMLDRKLTIYRVHSLKGQSQTRLLSEEDLLADQAGDKHWNKDSKTLIKAGGENGKLLVLDAERAKEVGLARSIVQDVSDLQDSYGLKKVRDGGFDFLYELASFLRLPAVALFLIMIGIACLILELKMPGASLPGIIAAVCFVLYFWAQSQLAGQIIMLAILLFILGLVLIGLEIFVIPGFGVTGISGIILVVVSLGLATLEKRPETTQEWLSFGRTLGAVGLSMIGAIILAFVGAYYLPSMPIANRLVLRPPKEARDEYDEEAGVSHDNILPDLASLLGAIGVAATTLRPAGIARFGDSFVDVISEGSFIPAGTRVQVIEIEGHRVVVKEV